MKVSAADILQFDPSKRKKKLAPNPYEEDFAREMAQEGPGGAPIYDPNDPEGEKAAIYFQYDNTLKELTELLNQFKALGEMDVVERIGRALAALNNEY